MPSELKHCPFCGEAVTLESMWTSAFGKAWTVRHSRRKVMGCKMVIDIHVKTKRTAYRHWNARKEG